MPKSYLPDEPGAMRALHHQFDPYAQVSARLKALEAVGHPIDKIELLILGGTWSSYRRDYQEWFVKQCLNAMNRSNSISLLDAQMANEKAERRNVGMVIETRPDHVTTDEIAWMRYLGVTKVQMGAQSFDDRILELNKRGHTAEETQYAVSMLRAAGFKIVLHWMPNLLGADPEHDLEDFKKLWHGYCPDEIKIYPTQLLQNADLYDSWKNGNYKPYTTKELIELIVDIKPAIPKYCRVNRIIRDIPSTNVVQGNKRTSLRQDVQRKLKEQGKRCLCIRCREIRNKKFDPTNLIYEVEVYFPAGGEEQFLSYRTEEDKLAGFLRLSLPGADAPDTGLLDLVDAAIIREVHVFGQSVSLGEGISGVAQHTGIGTRLIEKSEEIARQKGYGHLAVISAIGTREYYLNRGFIRGQSYLVKEI